MTYEYGLDPDVITGVSVLGALGGLLIVMAVIAIMVGITVYVFTSLSLYTIAQNRNFDKPWLAWIPVGNAYLLGQLGDYYDAQNQKKPMNLAMIMLIISAVAVGCSIVPFLAFLAPFAIVALAVFNYICIYKFYNAVSPDNATVLLVLSIIFSIAMPFILFAHRNYTDVNINHKPAFTYAEPHNHN